MRPRVVYDTMVFFQWAVLAEGRQYRTVGALEDGSARLCLSPELLREVRDVLTRPELVARYPRLTADRVDGVIARAVAHADHFDPVAPALTWPRHPDDDHVLNLPIAADALYLVTWETRILALATERSPDADRLRALAPRLSIVSPPEFAAALSRDAAE